MNKLLTLEEKKRNRKYLNMLDELKDNRFDLTKMDKNSSIYKLLSETQLTYMYVEIALQCKMKNNLKIADFFERPAFLWSDKQIISRLKKKYALKSVPLYMRRINILLEAGFIKKIPFFALESTIIGLLDDNEIREKPSLYVMVDVTQNMLDRLPYQPIDFDSVSLIKIQEQEQQEKLKELRQAKVVNKSKIKTSNKKVAQNSFKDNTVKSTTDGLQKNSNTSVRWVNNLSSSNVPNNNLINNELVSMAEEKKNLKIESLKDNFKVIDKAIEISEFNFKVLNSASFTAKYISLHNFLENEKLSSFYCDILEYNNSLNRIYYFEYKKKPVLYIDKNTIATIYQQRNNMIITGREASKYLDLICETGLLKKISSKELANDLKVTRKELSKIMEENSFSNFNSSSVFFVMPRLTDSLLTRANLLIAPNFTTPKTNLNKSSSIKNQSEQKSEKDKIVPPSITQCAIEILNDYQIDNDKVTMDKSKFDALIQAILGERTSI